MRKAIVTGSAGFIGHHLCARLLAEGWQVHGIDALTDYYDIRLKEDRNALLAAQPGFHLTRARIEDEGVLDGLFARVRPDVVYHLAAQAGVRHSIDAPGEYLSSNIIGTFRLLEAARAHPVRHLLIASTSSVYGANEKMPYAETDKADSQLSFYAATKKSCESMAHAYAHLFAQPITLFRFFTVYGPWGRPDMAYWLFTRAILDGKPIDVFNHGRMKRDFTYIDDLIEALSRLADRPPAPADAHNIGPAPCRVVNIGNASPIALMDFIAAIENATGRKAQMNFKPMQAGDVPATWASNDVLHALTGFRPSTGVAEGVPKFVDWYLDYRKEPAGGAPGRDAKRAK